MLLKVYRLLADVSIRDLLFSFELCIYVTDEAGGLLAQATCYFLLNYVAVALPALAYDEMQVLLLFSFELCRSYHSLSQYRYHGLAIFF